MLFRQFRYVLKVAEERSFSMAAKKLFISQPSLSQFIQKVEEQVGAPLFDRSVSPLKLTYIGQLYIENAKAIMDLQQQFVQQVDDVLNVKQGKIKIGSSPFRSAYFLSKILPLFRQKYPNIEVSIQENTTAQLEQHSLSGDTDLALSILPVDTQAFDYQVLFDERILLAVPPEHPISQRLQLKAGDHSRLPNISLAELQHTPFIQMSKNHKLHNMLVEFCQQAGFSPQIIFQTDSMITAQALAGAGMGATLLPETLISAEHFEKEPCYCRLDFDPRRTVVVMYRKNHYLSKAAKAFMALLQEAVESDKIRALA